MHAHAAAVPRTAPPRLSALAAYLAVYVAFWTLIPLLLQQEPPIDNVEQLQWALHPALGYAKHPPLPTLLLWLFERVLPAGIPLTYLLGALQVSFTLGIAYALGRASLDGRRARLGVLLITCISYHTLRMHYYNHNTALLCATAAAMYCTWRAVRGTGFGWWVALGVCWAAGMLSKYQMVLPIACNLLFATLQLRARPAALISRLACATLVALLLFSPHALWLVRNDFPTFHYAADVLGDSLGFAARCDSLLRFAASQALRLLPAAVALATLRRIAATHATAPAPPPPADSRRFWGIHAFGPLALMALMTLAGGVDLEMHWGTAFLWTLPLWYLSTPRGAVLANLPARTVLILIAAVQLLLMGGKVLFPDA